MAITVLTLTGVALAAAVALITSDVIMGVIAGAGFTALTVQLVKLRGRQSKPPPAPIGGRVPRH